MYDRKIKYKAKSLRENGTSLGEISTTLNVNKSTASYWCRDIKLDERAIKKIKTNGRSKSIQALLRYSEVKRAERILRTAKNKKLGAETVGNLSDRDFLMVGIGLYWGEGYKESNGELGFTNSSQSMIKFYLSWLSLWGVNKSDLIFRITINKVFQEHQEKIKKFWITFLSVKGNQFSKTTIIKTKLKKVFIKENHTYKGILRVKVRRGLLLKNKILGAIEHISNSSLI